MDALKEALAKLKVPTNDIEQQVLQDIIYITKKHFSTDCTHIYDEVFNKLWNHLCKGFVIFDSQLLCATCIFSVLIKSENKYFYLEKINNVVDSVILSKDDDLSRNNNLTLAISLIYGMFQSSYLQNSLVNQDTLKVLLNSSFCLLTCMAYDYSQYTYIIFKTMTCFKKVISTDLEKIIFSEYNVIKLLNICNHNWESPITGVRNMNRNIFQTVISILETDTHNIIFGEINMFYWNKAKFLMLTEIIEEYDGNIEELVTTNEWITGLTYSLNKTGLVSAGADMYYAILKKIKSHENWTSMFLKDVIKILCGSSIKALENYYNYWCLSTIKKFPQLFHTIVQEVRNSEHYKSNLYSFLFLLKQGNKLCLLKKNWHDFQNDDILITILNSTEHFNPNIRLLAFEIICVSNNKTFPTPIEYNTVLNFLWSNVNSDCTILRLSMLNSFGSCMFKLQTLFVYNLRKNNKEEILQLQAFYKSLQMLIMKSLKLDGNYQRRITTIKILDLLLKHTQEKPKKVEKQSIATSVTLYDFLNDTGNWILNNEDFVSQLIYLLKDPANDVHECVFQILLNYYSEILSETSRLNDLIDDGNKCLSSKFFYEISCGQLIYKLIINILIKYEVNAKFKNVQEIYDFAYNELHSHYESNTFELIENGKQLHSFISLLCVTLEACIKHTYKLITSTDTLIALLKILNCISNQFAAQKDTLISSDFSKMNDMVQCIIIDAGYNPEDENDKCKISGLHQLVLNCLWLNLKSSCELSSLIIQYNIENEQICSQCLNGITNVLDTSRHKGAIEAAGTALGNSIKHLTSQSRNPDVSKLPFKLLEKKLHELISSKAHSETASITRRGAGLSIMIHKIVSNDMQKGKPLFHHVMKVLLSVCQCSDTSITNSISENEKDLPKAIYIHFLTKIVMDSSLASDTMFYATEIAEIVFQNLTNTHWQIRNAALQLYGALVPKLIGQKKASEIGDETAATVACDEFRTHFSKLWMYIIHEIKQTNDDIQSHSNLFPILNILASVAKRYNFSSDQDLSINLLTKSLIRLLGSKLHIVRTLTAKAISNLSCDKILDTFSENNTVTENFLHGILLLILNFKCNGAFQEKHLNLAKKMLNMRTNHSYFSKLISEKILRNESEIASLQDTLYTLQSNKQEPGIFLWANARIEKCIQEACWDNIIEMVKLLLKFDNMEQYLEVLCQRIKNSNTIPYEAAINLTKLLVENLHKKYHICSIWKILYCISLKCSLKQFINDNLIEKCITCDNLHRNRYLIPLLVRELAICSNNIGLLPICRIMYNLCNPNGTDIDLRYISVISNNELANEFSHLTDDVKIYAVKTAIILLQDEDEHIRNSSVHFYKIIRHENQANHPYICLNKMLEITFMQSIFKDYKSCVTLICNDLLKFANSLKLQSNDNYNPFANNSKNIYLEVTLLEKLVNDLIISCT